MRERRARLWPYLAACGVFLAVCIGVTVAGSMWLPDESPASRDEMTVDELLDELISDPRKFDGVRIVPAASDPMLPGRYVGYITSEAVLFTPTLESPALETRLLLYAAQSSAWHASGTPDFAGELLGFRVVPRDGSAQFSARRTCTGDGGAAAVRRNALPETTDMAIALDLLSPGVISLVEAYACPSGNSFATWRYDNGLGRVGAISRDREATSLVFPAPRDRWATFERNGVVGVVAGNEVNDGDFPGCFAAAKDAATGVTTSIYMPTEGAQFCVNALATIVSVRP